MIYKKETPFDKLTLEQLIPLLSAIQYYFDGEDDRFDILCDLATQIKASIDFKKGYIQ